MDILVINGPNLNLLGAREPDIYGSDTYEDLCKLITDYCEKEKINVYFYQSNHEGSIVDRIQEAMNDGTDGIVINPAAYTHTSVAILDALKAVKIPTVEVHISDVDEREEFRKLSYVSLVALKTIKGKGFEGYLLAIDFLKNFISDLKNND
ncbi:MAG: type II 3-dehydroquinate dehydratase [Oscillospiraceae bacterium]|nr:type II 3-dehydroquinate dehydratase [Oscillospiraceae bacterium]